MFELYPAGDTPHLDGSVYDITGEEMSPNTIDDFGDGDLDEYSVPDGVSLESRAVYSGGYAAILGVNADQLTTPLASVTGLRTYPRIGDTISVTWRLGDPANHADTGSDLGGVFATDLALQSETDSRYRIAADFDAGDVAMQDTAGASLVRLGGDSVTWSPWTWYETTIEWLPTGVFVVEVRDVDSGTQVARFDTSGSADRDDVGGGFGFGMQGLHQDIAVDAVVLQDRDGWPAHPVDGFEDFSLTDYSRIDAKWTVAREAALTGRYGARASASSNGGFLISMPGQGLPAYPKAGETTRVDFRFESPGGYVALYLGVRDSSGSTRYEIRFHQAFGQVIVALRSGGTDVLDTIETTFEPGVTYRAEVEWTTGGVFDVSIMNRDASEHLVSVDTTNAPDQSFTEGGYGLFASPDADVAIDTVELIGKDSLLEGTPAVTRETLESFEDGDMAEYVTYKAGSGTFAATQSPNAVHGDNICLVSNSVNGGGAIDVANSLSGLQGYPRRGDTFGCFIGTKYDNTKASIAWACQEDRNAYPWGYHVWLDGRDDTLTLLKYTEAHDRVIIDSAGVDATAWNNGEMCRIEVEFGSPTITATLLDSNDNRIQQVSGNDSELNSGGLGFGMEKGTESDTTAELYFDYFYRVATA